MRILIAEDEEHLANGLKFNLEAEGHDVTLAHDGVGALQKCEDEHFDLLVFDVMMPGMTGFEVLRALRSRDDFTPAIILTALGKSEDVLEGFEAGADDYLAKPFELAIFLARVNGLLRRKRWTSEGETDSKKMTSAGPNLTINDRVIDFENLELRYEGTVTRLTLMESKLLEFLISKAGQIISRKTLLEEVWGVRQDTDTRAVDNFIVRLRKYLGDGDGDHKLLETIRGVGYRLNLPGS